MDKKILKIGNEKIQEPGILFYTFDRSNAPGYRQLDITISSSETQVERGMVTQIELSYITPEGYSQLTTLTHPINSIQKGRFLAGLIHFQRKAKKHFTAYTFGGEVDFSTTTDHSIVTLTSSAPILWLYQFNHIASLLADEAQILIAESPAAKNRDTDKLDKKLSTIDPMRLYCSSLKDTFEKYSSMYIERTPKYEQFLLFINKEIQSLKELDIWFEPVKSVNELLN